MKEFKKARKSRKLRKILKKVFLLTLPSLLLCWILLEIVFRTVIPADNPPRTYFDEAEKLLRYSNTPQRGRKTIGRFAEIQAQWRINNMGWNYPIDYSPQRKNKLIAVIGDSYVEALQVNVDQNYPYRLREKLQPDYEVYAFGISGAPLSHYLHISRYVAKQFCPDILIFNIIQNDFDESLRALYPEFYFYMQLAVDDDGTIRELPPRPIIGRAQYRPWWQKLLLQSALFRYLHFNLKCTHSVKEFFRLNACAFGEDIQEERNDIVQATQYVVESIRRENPGRRIIFVMDAPRWAIYNDPMNESILSRMNIMMKKICAANDVEFLDLTTFLQADYRIHKKRFEFPMDGHWNSYGHQKIADILCDYISKDR